MSMRKPNAHPVRAVGLALMLWILSPGAALAQVPQDTSFSGRLVSGGTPLAGPVDFDLLVYDADTGGPVLYLERHTSVPLEPDGSFSVLLGGGATLVGTFGASLFSEPDRYIEVGLLSPVIETLEPRVPIASAPWALVAETVISQPGNVSVSGLAFSDEIGGAFGCEDNKASGVFFRYRGVGSSCNADAPIQLPDGVTVISMSCTLFDDNASDAIFVNLRRVNLSNGGTADVFATPATTDSASVAIYTDLAPFFGTGVIDNSTYAYSLRADFGTGLPGPFLQLYGCTVAYE